MKTKNSKYIFFVGLLLAILVTAGTFAINLGGAWDGGPANVGQLLMTIVYIAFWCSFSWFSLKYKSLLKVTFVCGLLTFLSALLSFVCVMTNRGFIIEALLSVFASVPFYGFRFFMSWEVLYGIVSIISFLWLGFTVIQVRKK